MNNLNNSVATLNDASFKEMVLHAKLPVLVDFWAEWCGPCKMIAPILETLAPLYLGKIKIYKLNVDENQETPAKYSVRSIPTLILFKDGKAQVTKVGVLSQQQLQTLLDEYIA